MESSCIFADVQNFLNEYIAFPDAEDTGDQSLIVTLWVFHTWTFSESFPRTPWTTPYLYVHSPEKQSGKTLLIDLLESLVLNPERGVDMTSATLFRLIESVHPTLFIDEVQTLFHGRTNDDLRRVLNGGYKHSGYVWRVVSTPDGPEPKKFGTFCPKLLAGIDNERMPDDTLDRCIPILLQRKGPDQKRTEYYSFQAEPIAEALTTQIHHWTRDNGPAITDYMPDPIPGIDNRAWEVSLPLVQIAHAAGLESMAREALGRLLSPRDKKDSPGVRLLRDIRDAFSDNGAIFVSALVEQLNETRGGGWNGKLLRERLRPYGVEAAQLMTIGNHTGRGYYRFQFEDTWRRYL